MYHCSQNHLRLHGTIWSAYCNPHIWLPHFFSHTFVTIRISVSFLFEARILGIFFFASYSHPMGIETTICLYARWVFLSSAFFPDLDFFLFFDNAEEHISFHKVEIRICTCTTYIRYSRDKK